MSDTHSFHHHIPEIPDGDILVHCGDFTLAGSINEVVDFADWFGKLPHPEKIVISGNHERCISEERILGEKIFTHSHYLDNSSIEIDGLKFYGSPWTPSFRQMREGLGFYKHHMSASSYGHIPRDTDVLITHGPPAFILDEPYSGAEHVGCGYLLNKVTKLDPKVHAFGHIHEAYGIKKGYKPSDCDTTFINCSLIDHSYNLVHKPIVYNLR
jgi:Icc-related predicted phosphoesterase